MTEPATPPEFIPQRQRRGSVFSASSAQPKPIAQHTPSNRKATAHQMSCRDVLICLNLYSESLRKNFEGQEHDLVCEIFIGLEGRYDNAAIRHQLQRISACFQTHGLITLSAFQPDPEVREKDMERLYRLARIADVLRIELYMQASETDEQAVFRC